MPHKAPNGAGAVALAGSPESGIDSTSLPAVPVRLLVVFVAALALLGAVWRLNWREDARVSETAARVVSAEMGRRELEALLSLIRDVEIGVRGFALTGEPQYLEPYETGRAAVPAQLRKVRETFADDPAQLLSLNELEPLIASRIDQADLVVRLRRDASFEVAQAEVASGRGKATMDAVRAAIADMDAVVLATFVEASARASKEAASARQLTVAGIGWSILMLVAVSWLMLRESGQRRRASQEALRAFSLLDGTRVAVFIFDPDTLRFSYVNQGAVDQLGYTEAELREMTPLDIKPDYDEPRFREMLSPLLSGALFSSTFTTVHRRKDGTDVPVEISLQCVAGTSPSRALVAFAHDVTGRKRIEEQGAANTKALKEFKAALDEHAIVAITDAHGTITYANDKFCLISKYAREELLGQDHRIINSGHHPTAFIRELWETIASGRVWRGEIKNRAKDGSFYWVDTTLVPFLGEDGKPAQYVAIRADITKRKQVEEQILQLNADLEHRAAQLEAANKDLDSFSYSVSHDLRAPLRHIHGFVSMTLETVGDTFPPEGRRNLEMAMTAAMRMNQLIRNLLEFSHASRAQLRAKPFDLASLVGEAIDETVRDAKDRPIQWNVHVLPEVYGDRALLRQVLVNLIGNAVKFTRHREPASIEIGVEPDDRDIVVFVRDNGAGFDMRHADRLFGVFQRLHEAQQFEGTGIGLANVQRIVERHGGRVWAEGQVDRGATFFFTLPRTDRCQS